MSLNDWIKEQEQRGITTFSFQQIRCVFAERSEKTLKTDINRLTLSKRIQNVYKGFYVIIPTQYQLKGVVPPTYYINELMEYLGKPYYVGLLSAAAIYGASHQRAMMTQIVTTGPRARTSNKNTLLNWNYRQQIPNELIEIRNAEMGQIKYSSAELTAVDIVQFASNIGGYQRAATVLAELVDVLDMPKMEGVLPYTTTTAMQRFGYLLEFVLFEQDKADQLYDIMKKRNGYFNAVLMSSEHPSPDDTESNRWRVNMNIDIEIDELIGTKLRALYQRKKGRDLFDMQVALDHGNINIEKTLECYNKYMDFVVEKAPTYKQFVQNMELKLQDSEFLDDTDILLRTGADKFDPQRAYAMVKEAFIDKLPGKRD